MNEKRASELTIGLTQKYELMQYRECSGIVALLSTVFEAKDVALEFRCAGPWTDQPDDNRYL
jgi:hypothetical protein